MHVNMFWKLGFKNWRWVWFLKLILNQNNNYKLLLLLFWNFEVWLPTTTKCGCNSLVPRLLDHWIHYFFIGPYSLQLVNSLKIQWKAKIPESIILYNESKHNILALKQKQKVSLVHHHRVSDFIEFWMNSLVILKHNNPVRT
jgi:hypothetical protein